MVISTTALSPTEVDHFYKTLSEKLYRVPEIQPALELASEDPALAFEIYSQYVGVIEKLSSLNSNDLKRVQQTWRRLSRSNQGAHSASKTNAADILLTLGDERSGVLTDAASKATEVDSKRASIALIELAAMMNGGSRMKTLGQSPKDGDPASDRVIWGHTQITDPEALLHFVTCHYLERYFSQVLAAEGLPASKTRKDFFLNAMSDAMLVDNLEGENKFEPEMTMWLKSKEQGGLGWLGQRRIDMFAAPVFDNGVYL